MNSLRVPLIILAALYALLAAFGMGISAFADGGFWWERIPLALLHPLAALSLLWLLFAARPTPGLAGTALALLAVAIVGSLTMSGSMLLGVTKGDWWLPLVWAVAPLLSLPYVMSFLGKPEEDLPRFAA